MENSNVKNYKSTSRGRIYILFILYKIILDFVYIFVVSPIYDYSYLIIDFNFGKYLLSWLYLALIAFLIPKGKEKVSYLVLQLHALIMIIPMLTIYAMVDKQSDFMFAIMCCFIIEILVIKKNKLVIKIPKIVNSKFLINLIIYGCTIVTYVCLIYANGIHLDAINFTQIYEIRKNEVVPFAFLSYLTTWQYRIFNPYMIISSYLMNKKVTFKIFIALQVLLYFVTPHKEIIFSVFLIIGIILLLEKSNFLKSAIIGLSVATFGAVSIFLAKISVMPIAILPTRLLIEPAIIKFQHFEVFSKFENKLYYSEGIIGKILGINYPFNVPSGVVVHSYFDTSTSNSNTGYLAYAYDNMGYLGMIVMVLIFIITLLIIDSLSVKLNKNYVFALLIYQMFALNDGDLLTMFITGGLAISILILLLDQKSFDNERIKSKMEQNKLLFKKWKIKLTKRDKKT